MNARELSVLLRAIGACKDAVEWSSGKSFAEAWQECERAGWMLWLCGRMIGKDGWPSHEQIVLVCCDFAENALPLFEKKYPANQSVRKCIETTRAWAAGKATIDQAREARKIVGAADAAAYAAAFDRKKTEVLKEFANKVRERLTVPN